MSRPIVVMVCMRSSSESWELQAAPTSMALACRCRSRPQHQDRTHAVQQRATLSTSAAVRRSTFLRAVARRDTLLGCVFGGHLLDNRLCHGFVGCIPVRNDFPRAAVPLLNARRSRAFVISAGNLDRPHHALEAELVDAGGVELEVLKAPAHLLAGQRLFAKLLLRLADTFYSEHRSNEPSIV